MSSNKYLSAFFTSAAALGGLYLLDRFLGGEARANPKLYTHKKHLEEFTKEEKETIAKRYKDDKQSAASLAKEFNTLERSIRTILEEQGCDIRDKATAHALARKIELTDEQKKVIRDRWREDDAGHLPTIRSLAEAVGLTYYLVSTFLIEEGLYKKRVEQELSDEDKEKLVKAKEAANRDGRTLNFRKLGKDLKLDHKDVEPQVLLRFFAERGLNRYWDYTSSFSVDQQERILSYFEGGEQTHSLKDIADIERVARGPLQQFLYSHNIIPKASSSFIKVELDEEQKALMISLLEEGKTNKEIAGIMGISAPVIGTLIEEYRASQGRIGARLQESHIGLRPRLVTRDPNIVAFVMAERAKTPPTSYQKISARLKDEKGVSLSWGTARYIHLEELSKRK